MILVDTSVWVDFLRGGPSVLRLRRALELNEIVLHPFVLGELSLGNVGPSRRSFLGDLVRLPTVGVLEDTEVLRFVDAQRLQGTGIGWVDAHLLASAIVARAAVWTLDTALRRQVERLGALSSYGSR